MSNYINYNVRNNFVPTSINEDERSVKGVLASETPVLVFDWKRWEPIREVLLLSGMEVGKKVPLLDAHKRYNSDNVIGSSTDFKIEETDGVREITCRNIFSETENKLFKKVKEGHIDSTSVGYRVSDEESVTIPPGESFVVDGKEWKNDDTKFDLVIRKKWKVVENSLVPIGADDRSKFRSKSVPDNIDEKPQGETKENKSSSELPRSMRMNNNIFKHLKSK